MNADDKTKELVARLLEASQEARDAARRLIEDGADISGQYVLDLCKIVENEVAPALSHATAEGRRQGLEEAAKVCEGFEGEVFDYERCAGKIRALAQGSTNSTPQEQRNATGTGSTAQPARVEPNAAGQKARLPNATDDARVVGKDALQSEGTQTAPAHAAPAEKEAPQPQGALTEEEIEWIRKNCVLGECGLECGTPEVPTCACENRQDKLCDMALAYLKSRPSAEAHQFAFNLIHLDHHLGRQEMLTMARELLRIEREHKKMRGGV